MQRLAVVIALLLGACTTVQPTRPPTTELAKTHGFVHISLPSDNLDTATMTLRSRADDSRYALRHDALDPHGVGGWVPAGAYDIVEVTPREQTYVPLVVEAGRMTDAGGLFGFQLGNYEFVIVPVHRPELDAEAADAARRNADFLTKQAPIVWAPTDLPPRRTAQPKDGLMFGLVGIALMQIDFESNRQPVKERLAAAKTIDALWDAGAPTMKPLNPAVGGPDGRLYYPAALGQIRVRDASGRWSSIDTGTTYSVQAVLVDDDRIVVATRDGSIRVRDGASGTFRRVAHLPEGLRASSAARFDGRWFFCGLHIVTINRRAWADRVEIFEASRADLSDLVAVKTIAMHDQDSGAFFELAARGDRLYFNAGEDVLALGRGSREWTSIKPDHLTTALYVTPDGGILTAFYGRGLLSKVSTSSDQGRTWKGRPTPPITTTSVAFVDDDHGLATRFNSGAFKSTLEVHRFDPVTKGWVLESQAPPAGCNYALSDDARARFFCVSFNGSISRFEAGAPMKPEYVVD